MSEQDITLIEFPPQRGRGRSRLYYYQGNFFMPLTLINDEVGKVKRAIREFCKKNADLVKTDRAHPSYKNLVELFDEQEAQFSV